MHRFIKKPALWAMVPALFLAPVLCCCLTDAAAAAPAVTRAESAHAHCHKEEAPAQESAAAPEDGQCDCHQLSAAPSTDRFILIPPAAGLTDFTAAPAVSILSEVSSHRNYLNLSFLSPPVENDAPIYLTLANFRL